MNTSTSTSISDNTSTLIIINNQKKITSIHKIEKPITIISANLDSDIVINDLPKAGFSIIRETNGYKLLSMFEKQISSVPWNKLLKEITIFKLNQITIAFFPNIIIEYPHTSSSNDQDFTFHNFKNSIYIPQDPKDKNFPSKLLEFLLNIVGAKEGALFYYNNLEEEVPKELASGNFDINDQTMSLLQRYLKDNQSTIQQINFQTHSMLFSNKITNNISAMDFILLRTPCIDKGEVLLYIPKPTSKSKNINQHLNTILYLSSYALSLHVIYLYHQSTLKKISLEQNSKGLYWGQNPKMLRVKQLADRLASTDLSILITGETGVGKEGLAQYLFQKCQSQKSEITTSKKIVSVNCAAIPLGLAESILFGHVKGAFTHAHVNQIGKFQEANNGILFLDEVAELNLEIQGKLLRILQDGIVTPVGGKSEKIKVRVLTATHQDLFSLVKQKKFREDLYYRLNEATLHIPPLRERVADILPLSHYFLNETIMVNNLSSISFDREAINLLNSYSYPGNIRELRSIIRKVTILNNTGIISPLEIEEHLLTDKKSISSPKTINTHTSNQNQDQDQDQGQDQEDQDGSIFENWPFPHNLDDAKKIFLKNQIAHTLKITNDNKTKAAELLGITPRSLFRLLSENNIDKTTII
ncbi:MAG: sigma-54-dependent Fis family transcriptional regulator [Oligoflexia bacterium]|nr:sigma-54-dependent Fis family transcriptional regulator [Oligoflexia bacterium]